MKKLVLVRHAKTERAGPGQADRDRRLTERGHHDAALVADWLAAHGPAPDLALVSDAARAVETWEAMAPHLACEPRPVFRPYLYLAPPDKMLAALQGADGNVVLMIGHNDGLAQFAAQIAGQPPEHPSFAAYPTGALSVIAFDVAEWSQADWGLGQVRAFVVPSELGGGRRGGANARGSG